jgi:translation initiation factor 4G
MPVCRYFNTPGGCRRDPCRFLHQVSPAELPSGLTAVSQTRGQLPRPRNIETDSIAPNYIPKPGGASRQDDDVAGAVDASLAMHLVYVDRKVKSLLDDLTMENFESISQQILEWINRSVNESDGRTMIQIITLVIDKATDEANRSEMYARLCRFLMERISQDVRDERIKNTDGKPISGGNLFRKYLLGRCHEDFEKGWSAGEAAMQAAGKAEGDNAAAKKAGNGEEVFYSDEYYAMQKARRRGLGLVRFIGELFKLQMLTERIMHECIKKLLSNVEDPEEEEIESLCTLLATVGQALDTVKARKHMDIYFSRMQELANSDQISSRIQFLLIVRALIPFLCHANCAVGHY